MPPGAPSNAGTDWYGTPTTPAEPPGPLDAATAKTEKAETAVTMEAIGKLLRNEIAPMKESMSKLENNLGDLRQTVDNRLKEFEARMDMAELRVAKLETLGEHPAESPSINRLTEQMQNLEQQIAKMKLEERGQAVEDIERERAAVIGGLKELANLEKSETWVRDKLWTLWAPMPTEVYCRGDFKGVVFAKFGSKEDRDAAVKALKKAGLKEHGHEVWAKEDLPIEFRAPKRLLLGLKYLLGINGVCRAQGLTRRWRNSPLVERRYFQHA